MSERQRFCWICGEPGATYTEGIYLCSKASCEDDPAAKEFWAVAAEREAHERAIEDLYQ